MNAPFIVCITPFSVLLRQLIIWWLGISFDIYQNTSYMESLLKILVMTVCAFIR